MFVTCIYDIYNNSEKIREYINFFKPLADGGLNIHLYTSPELFHHFENYPKNVKVIQKSLEELEIYNLGMTCNAELANERNKDKDTKEYLSLMNSKIEFLKKSYEVCNDNNFIWIDFAILKLFKNINKVIENLKSFDNLKFEKIIMPGCWESHFGLFLHAIHWRFCGSMIIIPQKYIHRFYNDCKECFLEFINKDNVLTWEVNVWCKVESNKGSEYIKWYYALHDDSMINNIFSIIDS